MSVAVKTRRSDRWAAHPWRPTALPRSDGGPSCLHSQPVLVGVGDGLPSVSRMDLHEQPVDVALDRALADDQVFGDLGVGEPGGDEAKYFDLTGREPVGKSRWWQGVFRGSAGDGFDEVTLHCRVDDGLIVEDLL